MPDLALETYPPAAREMISKVHADAVKRPSDADAVGALGRALQAWEQWESAHASYARAHALAPKAFEWPYLDAFVLQRLARHKEAASRLREALATDPTYLPGRVRLAEALLDAGDTRESAKLFEALLREPAAEPAARVGLGRIAALEGKHEAAIEHLQRAVALFPELGAAHYALARSYRALGRREEAAKALAKHAQYGPLWPKIEDPVLDEVSALRTDPQSLLQRGIAMAGRGDVQAAITLHERALEEDPSLAQAHANLVSLYGRLRDWTKAEAHYRAATAAGVNTAELHYDLGVVLSEQGRWEESAEAYRKAIAVNPMHASARNNLGQLLERQRDFEAAMAEYRKAVEAQPSLRVARFNLGRMLLVAGQPDEAAGEFERILQPEDAETPRYVFALSTAHVRAGRIAEGIKWATMAKELAKKFGQTELAAAIERDLATLK